MSKYIVRVKEIYVNYVEIEADSEEDAKTLVKNGGGESAGVRYLETENSDSWTVSKEE